MFLPFYFSVFAVALTSLRVQLKKRKKYQNIKPNFYKKVDKVIIVCYNKFEVKGNDKPLAKNEKIKSMRKYYGTNRRGDEKSNY